MVYALHNSIFQERYFKINFYRFKNIFQLLLSSEKNVSATISEVSLPQISFSVAMTVVRNEPQGLPRYFVLLIKNFKNSRCANLLVNRKLDLLFILSQSKADMQKLILHNGNTFKM